MSKSVTLALVAALAVTTLGCAREYLHASSVAYEGVSVEPSQVWISGHKLWVRAVVINSGTQPIQVSRDAMIARVPSGQVVSRALGTTTVHDVYFIPGGAAHAVYVEFHEAGFDWNTVPQATIDFSNAITRDGQHLPLAMTVTH